MKEKICPKHGPYDASLPGCPYCNGGGRPPAPGGLGDDDMPTDIGMGGFNSMDEEATDIPSRRMHNRVSDLNEEEPTELGRSPRDEDITEIEFTDNSAQAILWVKEGDRRGRIYKVKDGCVVGRKEGDIVLDDPKVSNPHAKIVLENEAFVVWDFGSKNGTFVNGERIRSATALKENDAIKIGDSVFILKVLN
jgi:pSer/pThr/pTyr-binding forkhead associated (FHA) protein